MTVLDANGGLALAMFAMPAMADGQKRNGVGSPKVWLPARTASVRCGAFCCATESRN